MRSLGHVGALFRLISGFNLCLYYNLNQINLYALLTLAFIFISKIILIFYFFLSVWDWQTCCATIFLIGWFSLSLAVVSFFACSFSFFFPLLFPLLFPFPSSSCPLSPLLLLYSSLLPLFSTFSFFHFPSMATSKSASYDYLIKLLLIGDSGNYFISHTFNALRIRLITQFIITLLLLH